MHRLLPRSRPALLATVLLLVSLAGCGLTEEDERVCADVVCTVGYCLAKAGQPVCHCGALEWSLGQTCASQSPETLDDDGSPQAATPLEPSATAHTFTFDSSSDRSKTDVDYFSFQGLAGHIYRATCLGAGCQVEIQNEAKERLAFTYTLGDPVLAELSASGRYYVRAHTSSTFGGDYTLKLEDLGLDDVGDDRASALPRTPSAQSFSGLLETPTDVDAFVVQATAGRVYRFTCTVPEGTRWELLWEESIYAAPPAYANPSTQPRAEVSTLATSTGPLLARIRVSIHTPVAPFMHYLCWLEESLDDHAGTSAQATPLALGAPVSAQVQWWGDVDVLAFAGPTPAEHLYRLTVSPAANSSAIEFRDSASLPLSQSVVKGPESTVHTVKTRAAGALLVRIQGTPASYSLRLEDMGPEDHGDTQATATALEVGQTARGSVEVPADHDYFALSLAANQRYVLTSPSPVGFTLHAPDSMSLPFTRDGQTFAFTTRAAGTYFLQVSYSSINSGAAVPYELTVR